jgi:parallel beta-helix repeat protein
MRAIEVIVIIAMVMAFYALLAKSETFDVLPTPDLTDINSIRSDATEVYATVATWVMGNSPVVAERDPVTVCDGAISQALTPDQRLIILRLDDVQAWAWRDISIRIAEDALYRNIPITLGVIPKGIGEDKVLVGYLQQKTLDHRVEIAQHGTNHAGAEFANLSKWQAINLASSGKDALFDDIGTKPITFIPPENSYSANTTAALKSLGFSIISAGHNEFANDGKLQRVGYTTSTSQSGTDGNRRLVPPQAILDDCEKTSNAAKVCVIMIHPQDFANGDGSMDEAKYASFIQLLDRLETGRNYLFTTFRALFACPQVATALSVDKYSETLVLSDFITPPTLPVSAASGNVIEPSRKTNCVSHDSVAKTVTIECDADFEDVVAATKNSRLLRDDDNGTYTIDSSILVRDRASFTLQAPQLSWLRLEDRSSITIEGKLNLVGINITSWDSESNSVIESDDGTVFRGWISFDGSEGGVVRDSEISHLGYQSSVDNRAGFDLQSTHDLEITGSRIHDMYYAFHSNDAYNITISNNEYYNNILQAINPHSGTTDMKIMNNHIHDNKGLGIICSLDCNSIAIERNVIHDNGRAGIMLSTNTTSTIVRSNTIYNHPTDGGILMSESSNNYIYGNRFTNNGQGIYLKTSSNNVVERNSITGGDYGIIVATAGENNVARSNVIAGTQFAEYYLHDNAYLTIENSPFNKIRVEGGGGINTIAIKNSGQVFLFPTHHDTEDSPYMHTLNESSVTLRGGL